MAKHKVDLRLPRMNVSSVDVCFDVFRNDDKLGTLQVSKGRLDWFTGKSNRKAIQISWAQFDQFAQETKRKRKTKRR